MVPLYLPKHSTMLFIYTVIACLNYVVCTRDMSYFAAGSERQLIDGDIPHAKVVYITAVFGTYELSAKPKKNQTLLSDWICFTNNRKLTPNGWELDFEPYHIKFPSPIDDGKYTNSLLRNNGNNSFFKYFLIAKYYKQNYYNIPRLQRYEVVIWLDGTIEIIWDKTSEWVHNKIILNKQPIVSWAHELRKNGNLKDEVTVSKSQMKYFGQDLDFQYAEYLRHGYRSDFWELHRSAVNSSHPSFGLWITCFLAFDNRDALVKIFLDYWFLQTLMYSLQDQMGFPYALRSLNIIPYTLPDNEVSGMYGAHFQTQMYKRWNHGK